MKEARPTTLLPIVAAVVGLFVATGLEAQAVDVAGPWDLEVETDQGRTTPSWVLQQDGTSLSGSYSSEALGENQVRGSVDGSDVVIRFSASLQGQAIPVEYRGTLGSDGVMRGTIDIAGGMMQGRFTARRPELSGVWIR